MTCSQRVVFTFIRYLPIWFYFICLLNSVSPGRRRTSRPRKICYLFYRSAKQMFARPKIPSNRRQTTWSRHNSACWCEQLNALAIEVPQHPAET